MPIAQVIGKDKAKPQSKWQREELKVSLMLLKRHKSQNTVQTSIKLVQVGGKNGVRNETYPFINEILKLFGIKTVNAVGHIQGHVEFLELRRESHHCRGESERRWESNYGTVIKAKSNKREKSVIPTLTGWQWQIARWTDRFAIQETCSHHELNAYLRNQYRPTFP